MAIECEFSAVYGITLENDRGCQKSLFRHANVMLDVLVGAEQKGTELLLGVGRVNLTNGQVVQLYQTSIKSLTLVLFI